jgi:hypothetical protein
MKNKKSALFFLGIFLLGMSIFLTPSSALAVTSGWSVSNYTGYGLPEDSVYNIIENLMMWILSLVGIFAIIAFAISGVMYLTSAGNQGQIDNAKRYMVWSIVGVIVAIVGLVILRAVDLWLGGSKDF